MNPQPRCVSCRFWEATGQFTNSRIAGKCRRYPPSPTVLRATLWQLLFGKYQTAHQPSHTAPDDWCGEHQPAPSTAP